MELPETVEVASGVNPQGSVIWLHGLGADGHDFESIVPELGVADQLSLRFVFPHAPIRPVTINGGMTMRAWYDILTLERGGPQDEAGIRESGRLLELLIERECERDIPHDKIVLAGFSQGDAIALHAALRYPASAWRVDGVVHVAAVAGTVSTRKLSATPGRNRRSCRYSWPTAHLIPCCRWRLGNNPVRPWKKPDTRLNGTTIQWHTPSVLRKSPISEIGFCPYIRKYLRPRSKLFAVETEIRIAAASATRIEAAAHRNRSARHSPTTKSSNNGCHRCLPQ